MRCFLLVLVAISTCGNAQPEKPGGGNSMGGNSMTSSNTTTTSSTTTTTSSTTTTTTATTSKYTGSPTLAPVPTFPPFKFHCSDKGLISVNTTEIGLDKNGTLLIYRGQFSCSGSEEGMDALNATISFENCLPNKAVTVTLHHYHSAADISAKEHTVACRPKSYRVLAGVLEEEGRGEIPTVETVTYEVGKKTRNVYKMSITKMKDKDTEINIGDHLNITILAPPKRDIFIPLLCYAEPEPQTYPMPTAAYVFWDRFGLNSTGSNKCKENIDENVITSTWNDDTPLSKSATLLAFHFPGEDGVKITCEIQVCPEKLNGNVPISCPVEECPKKRARKINGGLRKSRNKVSAVFRVSKIKDVSDSSKGSNHFCHSAVMFVMFATSFTSRAMM